MYVAVDGVSRELLYARRARWIAILLRAAGELRIRTVRAAVVCAEPAALCLLSRPAGVAAAHNSKQSTHICDHLYYLLQF